MTSSYHLRVELCTAAELSADRRWVGVEVLPVHVVLPVVLRRGFHNLHLDAVVGVVDGGDLEAVGSEAEGEGVVGVVHVSYLITSRLNFARESEHCVEWPADHLDVIGAAVRFPTGYVVATGLHLLVGVTLGVHVLGEPGDGPRRLPPRRRRPRRRSAIRTEHP
jgi:hypothetical protein